MTLVDTPEKTTIPCLCIKYAGPVGPISLETYERLATLRTELGNFGGSGAQTRIGTIRWMKILPKLDKFFRPINYTERLGSFAGIDTQRQIELLAWSELVSSNPLWNINYENTGEGYVIRAKDMKEWRMYDFFFPLSERAGVVLKIEVRRERHGAKNLCMDISFTTRLLKKKKQSRYAEDSFRDSAVVRKSKRARIGPKLFRDMTAAIILCILKEQPTVICFSASGGEMASAPKSLKKERKLHWLYARTYVYYALVKRFANKCGYSFSFDGNFRELKFGHNDKKPPIGVLRKTLQNQTDNYDSQWLDGGSFRLRRKKIETRHLKFMKKYLAKYKFKFLV